MKTSELVKLLKRAGCTFYESGAEHDAWKCPNGKTIRIPRHGSKEIATGTLHRILKDAGLK